MILQAKAFGGGNVVKQVNNKGQTVYQCELREMGYVDMETAERCEAYCNTYSSCSREITQKAVYKPSAQLMS